MQLEIIDERYEEYTPQRLRTARAFFKKTDYESVAYMSYDDMKVAIKQEEVGCFALIGNRFDTDYLYAVAYNTKTPTIKRLDVKFILINK